MRLGPSHFIKFCSTNRANTNRDGRCLCIERRNAIPHFTFGLALHAICFHTFTLFIDVIASRKAAKQSPHELRIASSLTLRLRSLSLAEFILSKAEGLSERHSSQRHML